MKRLFQFLSLFLLFMMVFELSRLYFILYNFKLCETNLLTVFLLTAWKGFFMDVSATGYCLAPFLLILLIQDLLKLKISPVVYKIVLFTELFLIGLVTIADPELYRQWGGKFNNQVLVYITHPVEMAISSGAINVSRTLAFSVCLIFAYALLWRRIFKVLMREVVASYQHLIAVILQALITFVMIRGGIGVTTISQSSAIFSDNRFYNSAAVNSLWNALYYIIYDTDSLYDNKYFPYQDEAVQQSVLGSLKTTGLNPDLTDLSQPNVMVVILESFTASGSAYFSGYNNCMPFLDSVAKNNLSFKSCYSSGDRTEKGLVAILSAYPSQPASSIIVFPDKSQKLLSLGSVLGKQGYHNSFFYGGDADFASMKAYMLMHGTDQIVDRSSFTSGEQNSKWGAHDGNLYKKVLDIHKDIAQPFFTTLLTLSSHEPYEVPHESPDLPKDNWYKYKNSIRYADKVLFDFLNECKQQPWYKNTLILLVADHGHDIGLDGFHFFGKEKYHIPLVVTGGALKKELKGVAYDQAVSQTVVPSLILGSFTKVPEGFNWQTGSLDSNGFAQYHYNSGFGRVGKGFELVGDNLDGSQFYKGNPADSSLHFKESRMFQQYLIRDFLKK